MDYPKFIVTNQKEESISIQLQQDSSTFLFQFWANYVTCDGQYKDAVRMTLDQMDVIKKFVARYPDTFTFVTTAQGLYMIKNKP